MTYMESPPKTGRSSFFPPKLSSVLMMATVVLLIMQYWIPLQRFNKFQNTIDDMNLASVSPKVKLRSFDLDPKDALLPVPEFFWSAQDIDKAVQATEPKSALVYFVTPTYYNPAQWVNLVRLSQTLMHDPLIHWIVVEDATNCTKRIRKLLDSTGMMYAHLASSTPRDVVNSKGAPQRNRALDHIEKLDGPDGVVYFGDDDNAYDLQLFPELRKTQRVSIFSVAFVGGSWYERCIVDPTTGKVARTASNWQKNRTFPMDMGGLAFHTSVIKSKNPRFRYDCERGRLETTFVEQVAGNLSELEPLNSNCTRIYTWHVKTGITSNLATKVADDPDFGNLTGLI